jgi:serine palmitoyltransferase
MTGETNPGNPEILLNPFTSFTSYFSYGNLFVFGHVRDFIDYLVCKKVESKKIKGYKELTKGFDAFYRRRLYDRIHTCWNRPICSNAGPRIEVLKRQGKTKSDVTGEIHEAINISSYNYLGFATPGGVLEPTVLDTLNRFGISTTSAINVAGRTKTHTDLENIVSEFLNVEDAMIFGMGWATNVTGIPTLIGSGCLVISDSLNHNSIFYI